MKRRTVLTSAGGIGLLALAGCLQGGGTNDDPYENSTPGLIDQSFEVTSVQSGNEIQEASVSFEDGVVVEGTTTGNDGCYTAELAGVTFDQGEFDVTVEAVEDENAGDMCTQALVEIDYRATFQFEGSLPDRVTVTHDSMGERRTVAEADR